MTDFTKVQQALERRGYTVRTFAAAAEAAAYLDVSSHRSVMM